VTKGADTRTAEAGAAGGDGASTSAKSSAGLATLTSPSCDVRLRMDCCAGSLLGITVTVAGCGFAVRAAKAVNTPRGAVLGAFAGKERASFSGSRGFWAVLGVRSSGFQRISVPRLEDVGAVEGSGLGGTGSSWNGSLALGIGGPSDRTPLQQLGSLQQVGVLQQLGAQLVVHDEAQQPPPHRPPHDLQPIPHLPPSTQPWPKPQHTLHGNKQSSIRPTLSSRHSGWQWQQAGQCSS
jgi:hypothetical protein